MTCRIDLRKHSEHYSTERQARTQVRRCAGIGSAWRRTDHLQEWCFRASGSAAPLEELPPCASWGGRSTRSIVVHSHYRCAAGGDLPEMQVPKKSQASIGTPKGLHRVLRSVRVVWCAEYRGQRRAHIHSTEARASKHTQGSKRAASPPYSGGGEIAATSVTSAASLSGSEPCQPWPCQP